MAALFCYTDVMFDTVFITPAIDILIFTSIAYGCAYLIYMTVYKKDFNAVMSVDVKFSIMLLLLVIAAYYGSGISVVAFGTEMHWLLYYLVVSGLIEVVLFILYKENIGVSWSDIFSVPGE